jgi:hypothetical protein
MKFDWIKIEKECPKAFNLLKEWSNKKLFINTNGYLMYWDFDEVHVYDIKNLFLFFDEQKIFIEIMLTVTSVDPMEFLFIYNIVGEESNDIEFIDRESSNLAAFYESFRILEKRLCE